MSMASSAVDVAVRVTLRAFQAVALAEGGLLPAILLAALVAGSAGAATAVAVVGAAHGTAFTAYVLLTPLVAGLLRWSPRTSTVALSVAFVPFAPWAFERRIRGELTRRVERQRCAGMPGGATARRTAGCRASAIGRPLERGLKCRFGSTVQTRCKDDMRGCCTPS